MTQQRWRAVRVTLVSMQGITLVEMMVTLSIVAILTVLATPSFTGIIQKARLQAEANSLVGDLQFARSEAIKRGQPVSLCPSSNGTACSMTKPYAWEQGWIVFNDVNGSGSLDAPTDAPLRVRSSLSNGDTVTPTPSASAVVYSRDGFATNLSNGTVTMKLTTSPLNTSAMQCVEINMAGRQRALISGSASCN